MLLRELEYLVALAREQHFARAAEACHVSQPSLSTAIRKLERVLGVQIVQRTHRFAGLTPEGERVLRWAHRILAEATALKQDLASMRGGLTGTLRLGAIPTAMTAASLLTTPLCVRHPEVRVRLESVASREVAPLLAGFELDAALTYLDDETPAGLHAVPLPKPGLTVGRAVPLYEERYLLLTPDDGTLAGQPSVSWPEVAKLPLCLLTPRMRNRRIIDALFAAHGPVPAPAVETDTVDALYAHIATRRWSSVIAHSWLHTFGVPEGMRVVPMPAPDRPGRIGLVLADREPEPFLIRALLDVVAAADIRGTLGRLLADHLGG
ncbi:MAG: LysR family transcriptional regulator [Actinoplanes sp.]